MRRAAILTIVLFVSCAYFYQGGGWNQNTRFDLVRAIVERHTVQIDAYHENTGDKARLGDHVYADKAPGASLTAVPVVAIVYGLMATTGADVTTVGAITALSYVATVAAAALPAVCAALCVFLVTRRFGASEGAAGLAAATCGLGTPLWAYATILYGHTLAAGCLMLAFLGALTITDATSAARQTRIAVVTGLAAGWAVVTEYPAAIASGLIVLFALWRSWTADRSRFRRVVVAVGAGIAVTVLVLVVYNSLAFGRPFYIGYTSEEKGFEAMQTGIFGINLPKFSVMKELLFGDLRGLLPLAPVLIFAPVGFWFLLRDARTRVAGIVAAAIALYFFLFTSGYAYWEGGWSYASRHLGPALPFLCLGLAPVWQHAPRVVRTLVLALAVLSVGETLVAVATTAQPPFQYRDPMRELLWPAFKSGDFPIGWQSVLEKSAPSEPMSQLVAEGVPPASWNLGQLVGLKGHASLIPLYLVWLMGAIFWFRAEPNRPRAAARPSAG